MKHSYVVAIDSRTGEVLTLAGWRKKDNIDPAYPVVRWDSYREARNDRGVWNGTAPRWVHLVEWKKEDEKLRGFAATS
jgi:cell division protein FtsI/penicillin-binding protein 2